MIPISAPSFLKERQQKLDQLYANEERLSQQAPKSPDVSELPQSGLREEISTLDLHDEFVRKRMAFRQPCHTHEYDIAKTNKEIPKLSKEKNKPKTVLVERNNTRRDSESLIVKSELARKILAIQRGEIFPDPYQNSQPKVSTPSNKSSVKQTNVNSGETPTALSSQGVDSIHQYETFKNTKRTIHDPANLSFDTLEKNDQNELAQLKEFEAQALRDFANESVPQFTKQLPQVHIQPLQNCSEGQNPINNILSRNSFGLSHNIRSVHSLVKRKRTYNAKDSLLERARKVRSSILQNFDGTRVENLNSLDSLSKSVSSITVRVLHFSNNSNDSRSNHVSVPCEIIDQYSPESRSLIEFPENAKSLALNVKDRILVNFVFQLPSNKNTNANLKRDAFQPGNQFIINGPATYIGTSRFLSNGFSATKSFSELKAAIVAFTFSIN